MPILADDNTFTTSQSNLHLITSIPIDFWPHEVRIESFSITTAEPDQQVGFTCVSKDMGSMVLMESSYKHTTQSAIDLFFHGLTLVADLHDKTRLEKKKKMEFGTGDDLILSKLYEPTLNGKLQWYEAHTSEACAYRSELIGDKWTITIALHRGMSDVSITLSTTASEAYPFEECGPYLAHDLLEVVINQVKARQEKLNFVEEFRGYVLALADGEI
jgi:hypothetical protein